MRACGTIHVERVPCYLFVVAVSCLAIFSTSTSLSKEGSWELTKRMPGL